MPLKNTRYSGLKFIILTSFIKMFLLESIVFNAKNTSLLYLISGVIIVYILGSFLKKYFALSAITASMTKNDLRQLIDKHHLLKRKTVFYLINFLGNLILILTVNNFWLQQIFILSFVLANIAIFINSFYNNYQFRILYGLEVYFIFIIINILYNLLFYQYWNFSLWLLPFIILIISYFAFDYLLMKRKHRIYTTHCIRCQFRKHRRYYLIIYSLVCSLFFSILIFLKTTPLLAGIILLLIIHILRGFTCANFKTVVSQEMKQSYLYLLAILLLIAFSLSPLDTKGQINTPDPQNSQILKK